MRRNWSFSLWFIGPMRYPKWRIKYDLRSWMFGFECYFGGIRVGVGPLEIERLVTVAPRKADLQAVK